MQIKRFEAKNMAEAFKNIKQEFGPDAVILSAKTIQKEKGMFNAAKASRVEVLAANDTYVLSQDNNINKRQAIAKYTEKTEAIEKDKPKPKNGVFQTISSRLNPLKPFKVTENNPQNDTLDDLAELKRLKNHLLAQGIETNITSEIIDRVQRIKSSKKKNISKDMNMLLFYALEEIGIESAVDATEDHQHKMICLLGLTGVGKTTTLAKLAAIEIIENRKSVGVISLDSFRVGSNALLNVYANIIGFNVFSATTVKEVKTALKEYKDKDVILIDTPGIVLNDPYQKYQIKELIDKLGPDETHLLMHANVKKSDAKEITRQFELFEYNRILFTKIDETSTYGTIVNQLMETERPISFITEGQNIPEDIVKIDLNGLVNLLMKNKTAPSEQKYWKKNETERLNSTRSIQTDRQFQRMSFN